MSEQQTEQQGAEQGTEQAQAQRATEYVVLREVSLEAEQTGEGPIKGWQEYGVATARNYRDAIKSATRQEDGTNHDGKYKAVPKSSWDRWLGIDTAPRSLFSGSGGAEEDGTGE